MWSGSNTQASITNGWVTRSVPIASRRAERTSTSVRKVWRRQVLTVKKIGAARHMGATVIRHGGIIPPKNGAGTRPTLAANRRQNRLTLTRPQRQKIADFGAHPAPLFPVTHTDAPSDPRVDFRYGSVIVRDAEIIHPASDITREPVEPIGHRDTPASSGEFPDVMLEVGEGLVGPSQFRSSRGKPQELTVIGLDHSALLLVDRELQLAGQVPPSYGFRSPA